MADSNQSAVVTVSATKRVKVTVQTAGDREHHDNGSFVVEADGSRNFIVEPGTSIRVHSAPVEDAATGG